MSPSLNSDQGFRMGNTEKNRPLYSWTRITCFECRHHQHSHLLELAGFPTSPLGEKHKGWLTGCKQQVPWFFSFIDRNPGRRTGTVYTPLLIEKKNNAYPCRVIDNIYMHIYIFNKSLSSQGLLSAEAPPLQIVKKWLKNYKYKANNFRRD